MNRHLDGDEDSGSAENRSTAHRQGDTKLSAGKSSGFEGHEYTDHAKPPARRRNIDGDPHQMGASDVNGSAKIVEAPTSQNLAYFNSLAQEATDEMPPANLDTNIRPAAADNTQHASRGRQRYREEAAVPLRFVHVPNNAADLDGSKRAPSVPDLISYLNNHNREAIPLLSDETLRNKDRESRKEQFEERLRRAHLRVSSDAESSVTRYRSKSTPSRGGVWAKGRQSESGNATSTDAEALARYAAMIQGSSGETEERQYKTTGLDNADVGAFRASASNERVDEGLDTSSPPAVVITAQENPSPNTTDDVGIPHNILEDSSVKSSDGSLRVRTLSSTLEPPPPPPPATEKERLVERERQARLETERARRAHIALLRERQLEDSDDAVEREENDNNVELLGQVSFDVSSPPSPEFVGGGTPVLELPTANSSVGSSTGIPRPPLPPPPATERERLVERERQARLETERARRRQALVRERQLDEADSMDAEADHQSGGSHLDPSSPTPEPLPEAASSQTAELVGDCNGPTQTEAQSAEAGLSYPMERFLESSRVDEEAPTSLLLPAGAPAPDDAAASTLPYTMELFLAESAAAPPNDGVGVPENEEILIDSRDSDIDAVQIGQSEVSCASQQHLEPTMPLGLEVPPSLEDAILNDEVPPPPVEWREGTNDRSASSGSVASVIASTDGRSLRDHNMSTHNSLDDNQDLRANTASSSSRASVVPSQDSFDVNSHPPRLTEADIAQLEQLEHASTGNAAPQSVREEPSESSVAGREQFQDQAFSVATQTTVIESVTEASDGRIRGIAFSDIDESEESLNVVRIDSTGSVQYSSSTSGGASSASIEAMPSSELSGGSDNVGRLGRLPSEEMSGSISRSFAPSSLPSSSDDIIQRHQLTENDIVAMDEIDYASIGNAPPLSVRDEHLSESSVTSITERGVQFGVATITEVGSVDDNQPENASMEVPSVDSIAAMPSEHDQDEIQVSDDEEMLVYQASVGSSASIEALPSVDLEHEARNFDYGAVRDVEGFPEDISDGERDTESAPLISGRSNGLHLESISETEQKPHDALTRIAPALVLGVSELPTFIIVARSNEHLVSQLGVEVHQLALATIVVMIAAVNHSDKVPDPDLSQIAVELQSAAAIGTTIGLLVGLVGCLMSNFDVWLGTALLISSVAATFMSSLCKLFLIWATRALHQRHGRANAWTGPLITGCQDLVTCFVIMEVVRFLLTEEE